MLTKRISLFLLFCLVCFTVWIGSGCGKVSKRKIIVGTEATFPPYEYYDKGKVVGIDPAIMTKVAEDSGCALSIEEVGFDYLFEALKNGRIDVAASGITITEERKKIADFSEPYALSGLMILVPVHSTVKGPADLKGKIIGVQRTSTADEYVTKNIQTPSRFPNVEIAVSNLINGKIDAVVLDSDPAKVLVHQHKSLKLLDHYLTREEYAFAVRKGDKALLEKINRTLRKLKQSGGIEKLRTRYEKLASELKDKDGKEKMQLRVAIDATFPPIAYIKNGKPEGIEPDILRIAAQELNAELSFEPVGFDSLFEAVANDNGVDVGAGTISVTEERAKVVNFTLPYMSAEQFLFVPKNSTVTGISDLKGKRVGAIFNTTAESFLKKHLGTPECFSEGELLCQALDRGDLDAIMLDGEPAEVFMKRYKNMKKLPKPVLREEYAFAVRKANTDLLKKLNDVLLRLQADGTLRKIREKNIQMFRK